MKKLTALFIAALMLLAMVSVFAVPAFAAGESVDSVAVEDTTDALDEVFNENPDYAPDITDEQAETGGAIFDVVMTVLPFAGIAVVVIVIAVVIKKKKGKK